MNELCIPLPVFEEGQVADVEVKIGDKKKRFSFRVESFHWETDKAELPLSDKLLETAQRIEKLKQSIESYDKGWELIQIFTPEPASAFIRVLFRKRA